MGLKTDCLQMFISNYPLPPPPDPLLSSISILIPALFTWQKTWELFYEKSETGNPNSWLRMQTLKTRALSETLDSFHKQLDLLTPFQYWALEFLQLDGLVWGRKEQPFATENQLAEGMVISRGRLHSVWSEWSHGTQHTHRPLAWGVSCSAIAVLKFLINLNSCSVSEAYGTRTHAPWAWKQVWTWSRMASACSNLERSLGSQPEAGLGHNGENTRSLPLDQWSVTRALALQLCRRECPKTPPRIY